MLCPQCASTVADDARFCPSCGQALRASGQPAVTPDDATRLSPSNPGDATRLSPSNPSDATRLSPPTPSGWLTSSGSIDHGRFAPGAILDGRYRILGLIGRGGMGEVYRADDLRLGQPVALKFLPVDLARDTIRLAQFHNEVRTARQVSHPNVCRVYDIGEADGQLYLSMEYVDGEDLSTSLRRIGRFPEDKAIEIARQICAGLAAAHERGVLHRDLKPANIMLDGSGRVRVMDFSLASIGAVTDVRAGTPAYMAPEQLQGHEVTARSDIYALALVLYEVFTGRRAFTATTIADLVAQQQSLTVTWPTEIVKTLEPAIDRAILRCLDPDPSRRPASALAVSAALPGGDPLAAALAAGETPSPEMVAAAGGEEAAMSRRAAALWLVAAAVLALVASAVSDRVSLPALAPLTKPAAVLVDRSEEIRHGAGLTEAVGDETFGYYYDTFYIDWASEHGEAANRWRSLASGRPAVIRFWRRTSSRALVPMNPHSSPDTEDPPLALNGDAVIELDTAGLLLTFMAPPPEVEAGVAADSASPDWPKLFALAGLDPIAFHETPSERTPFTFADARHAWAGLWPGTSIPVRIEAASYRGRVVLFQLVSPWTPAEREPTTAVSNNGVGPLQAVLILGLLIAAAGFARANLRSGRADRRGAFRLATFEFLLLMASWSLSTHVLNLNAERMRLFLGIGLALFLAAALYLVYLALEPFVRRSWPTMLVGWSRLMSGRIRDAIVARDVLIGIACGAAVTIINLSFTIAPRLTGSPDADPNMPRLTALLGPRALGATLFGGVNNGLQNGLLTMLEFALFRELVQRAVARFKLSRVAADRIATALAVAVVTSVTVLDSSHGQRLSTAIVQAISTTLILTVMLRIGLLATVTMYVMAAIGLMVVPLTLDGSRLYSGPAWFVLALVFVVAAIAARIASTDVSPLGLARTGAPQRQRA